MSAAAARRPAQPAGDQADADATGLSQSDVRARVLAGQVNSSQQAPGRTVRQILRANLFTRFNAILGSLFAVVLVVGPLQDALFGFVLAANTGIGIAQELRAKRTLDRLAILPPPVPWWCATGQRLSCPSQRSCSTT